MFGHKVPYLGAWTLGTFRGKEEGLNPCALSAGTLRPYSIWDQLLLIWAKSGGCVIL